MEQTMRYGRLDRRARTITVVVLLLLVGLCVALFLTSGGANYLAAWTTSVAIALVALCMLSLPRRIILSDEELELRCLLETTYIRLSSIVDVEIVEGSGLSRKLPLLGTCGFGGYCGFWLDLATRRLYRCYIASRRQCVAIHTSHRRYLISAEEPTLLREQILATKARCAREE
ncbi:MAG: hypothetical protein J6K24_05455 [Tidjanibacter sp.]|nr:hypothetical protein [Tidjanibacter sp.]